jgi:hypothetical protein
MLEQLPYRPAASESSPPMVSNHTSILPSFTFFIPEANLFEADKYTDLIARANVNGQAVSGVPVAAKPGCADIMAAADMISIPAVISFDSVDTGSASSERIAGHAVPAAGRADAGPGTAGAVSGSAEPNSSVADEAADTDGASIVDAEANAGDEGEAPGVARSVVRACRNGIRNPGRDFCNAGGAVRCWGHRFGVSGSEIFSPGSGYRAAGNQFGILDIGSCIFGGRCFLPGDENRMQGRADSPACSRINRAEYSVRLARDGDRRIGLHFLF